MRTPIKVFILAGQSNMVGSDAHAVAHQGPVGRRVMGVAAEVRLAERQAQRLQPLQQHGAAHADTPASAGTVAKPRKPPFFK